MKTYKVLWLDDEYETLEILKEKASINGINHYGITNSIEGIAELEKNLMLYDAIIIDGLFSRKPGDSVSQNAMSDVFRCLDRLASKKALPAFILSGQSSFTKENNNLALAFTSGKVYDKNDDEEVAKLWMEIRTQADEQIETQIRHDFRRVFEVCTEKYIGEEAAKSLLYLIKTTEAENENTENKLNAIRKIIEKLFTAFNKMGVLPVEVLKGSGGLNKSRRLLSGTLSSYKNSAEILHPTISRLLENILDVTQDGSHSEGNLHLRTDEFIKLQATPYLFNSIIFQLLDVLIWFKCFSDDNQDVEKNGSLVTKIETETSIDYEGVIAQDENNNYYCGDYVLSYNLVNLNYKIGDRIKIIEAIENTQDRTKNRFPGFAKKFIKLK